jgi:hypothetical protein
MLRRPFEFTQAALVGMMDRLSGDRCTLESEADSHFDLKLELAAFLHGATDVPDLEPVDMAQRLARLGQSVADGLVNTLVGNSDHVDDLVGLIRHRALRSGVGWVKSSGHPASGCFFFIISLIASFQLLAAAFFKTLGYALDFVFPAFDLRAWTNS